MERVLSQVVFKEKVSSLMMLFAARLRGQWRKLRVCAHEYKSAHFAYAKMHIFPVVIEGTM